MRIPAPIKITLWIGTIAGVVVFASIGWCAYLSLRVRVALAEEQTRYFEEAVQAANQQGSVGELASFVNAITNYYPSGTRQRACSHLDLMVERARSNAIERIVQQGARRKGVAH